MKFYIAARYGRKADALELEQRLLDIGHEVTSSWIHQVEDEMLYDEGPDAAGRFAAKDLQEIDEADALVCLSEPTDNPWGRGGRHVEFGYALAQLDLVYVVGPLENIFHYLNDVVVAYSMDEFIQYLQEQ